MTSGESPTQKVVEKIAAANGVDPLELQPPLFEAIDPEALDTLFTSADPQTTVRFRYCGYDVTVDGTCNVELEPANCESEPVQAESTLSD